MRYFFHENLVLFLKIMLGDLMFFLQFSAQASLAGFFVPSGEEVWNQELLWQPVCLL